MSTILGITDGANYSKLWYMSMAQQLGWKFQESPSVCHMLVYSFWGSKHKQINTNFLVFHCQEPGDTRQFNYQAIIDTKNVPEKRRPGTKFLYMPFYVLNFYERRQNSPQDLIMPKPRYAKTKFCAFLYSHPVPFREALFHSISKYKPVDALGASCSKKSRGQTDRSLYNANQTYLDASVEKYKPFKFVICCENAKLQGYITEKIISAMLAGCIPIYLGAPDIKEHFNAKSFIHVEDYNEPQLLEKIKQIDTDHLIYEAMFNEPWFVNNKLNQYFDSNYGLDTIKSWHMSNNSLIRQVSQPNIIRNLKHSNMIRNTKNNLIQPPNINGLINNSSTNTLKKSINVLVRNKSLKRK